MINKEAPNTKELRDKAAAQAVSDINKEYGEGSILDLNSKVGIKVPSLSTGIFQLDHYVIGTGGIPRGRITEIYGPASSGKTTIALQAVASALRMGELAAYIDVEHALDPTWMKLNGVDVEKLMVSQPDYGEQALDIAVRLTESKAFAIIVIDSVAALTPKAELDGDMETQHMGLQARMMGKGCRKINAIASKANTAVVFINQLREKIGVMYGSPETTPGGKALGFYASLLLDVRRQEIIKKGDEPLGNKIKFKAAKNKMSTPFRECVTTLVYNKGFDSFGSTFEAAVDYKVVDRAGSWFSYKGDRLGQGADNAIALLVERGLCEQILAETIQAKDSVK